MRRVVVADDEADIRELCRTVLACEGYEVFTAETAAECISLVRQERPDLVLLDWMMPDLSGLDALWVLKGSMTTRDIPVVMLTALSGTSDIAVATSAGADGYVTKPFEVENLLSLVRRFTWIPEPVAA